VAPAFSDQKLAFIGSNVGCIFDVGASTGGYALKYRKLFPESRVYAIEAFGEHFQQLEANTGSDPRITPLHMAVSDVIGNLQLNVNVLPDTNSILVSNPAGTSGEYRTLRQETVPSVTLDHLAAAHNIGAIDILKMDIQGAELRALRGASRLLREHRIGIVYSEVLFRELYGGQPFFCDIANFLHGFGYRLVNLYDANFSGQEMQWADAIFASPKIGQIVRRS
jgi:FkbM family methyltransferase